MNLWWLLLIPGIIAYAAVAGLIFWPLRKNLFRGMDRHDADFFSGLGATFWPVTFVACVFLVIARGPYLVARQVANWSQRRSEPTEEKATDSIEIGLCDCPDCAKPSLSVPLDPQLQQVHNALKLDNDNDPSPTPF